MNLQTSFLFPHYLWLYQLCDTVWLLWFLESEILQIIPLVSNYWNADRSYCFLVLKLIYWGIKSFIMYLKLYSWCAVCLSCIYAGLLCFILSDFWLFIKSGDNKECWQYLWCLWRGVRVKASYPCCCAYHYLWLHFHGKSSIFVKIVLLYNFDYVMVAGINYIDIWVILAMLQ